jgi:hypothetical protein
MRRTVPVKKQNCAYSIKTLSSTSQTKTLDHLIVRSAGASQNLCRFHQFLSAFQIIGLRNRIRLSVILDQSTAEEDHFIDPRLSRLKNEDGQRIPVGITSLQCDMKVEVGEFG